MTLLYADLKPRGVVVNMIPGLPAHILFMCVRYADYLNDADMLKSFMNATIDGIKQVVKVGIMFGCTVFCDFWCEVYKMHAQYLGNADTFIC